MCVRGNVSCQVCVCVCVCASSYVCVCVFVYRCVSVREIGVYVCER